MSIVVETKSVRRGGLVGALCTPGGIAPAPGVLLLGGSEGGFHERDAQLLAAEGFTVLALAYFGAPSLPPGLIDVPLEYFFRGLDLLADQPRVGERFGIVGGSRGGEAALLAAAYDERVAAVVSVVGSGIVTEGIDYRAGTLLDILAATTNSWTLGGAPIPYLPYEASAQMRSRIAAGKSVGLGLAYPAIPTDAVTLERVSIPVEKIQGPVLLLSADDDRMWPSTAYSQVAAERRRAQGLPVEHHVFRGTGHSIAGPPRAGRAGTTAPGPGVTFQIGGTAAANAKATEQAWAATINFFEKNLT